MNVKREHIINYRIDVKDIGRREWQRKRTTTKIKEHGFDDIHNKNSILTGRFGQRNVAVATQTLNEKAYNELLNNFVIYHTL